MSSWCQHLRWNCRSKEWVEAGYESYTNMTRHVHENSWNFCPICGTPRPKEKTLAEKFGEFLFDSKNIMKGGVAENLARIAEDHFKGESEK